MKKVVKDGWHVVNGRDVFVKNGKVLRGLSDDGQRAVYPYRVSRLGGWTSCTPTIDALRAGLRRETMMWS